jgi:hypothetical protein
MAYSLPPDRTETYTNEGSDLKMILNFYNDAPGMVNWHEEYQDKSIGEAGTDEETEIRDQLESTGWVKE